MRDPIEKPVLVITMGDPGGIGPEVALKACQDDRVIQTCQPVVFGDLPTLRETAARMDVPLPPEISIDQFVAGNLFEFGPAVVHIGDNRHPFPPGKVDAKTGQASVDYVTSAVQLARDGRCDGIVTGPINKTAWHAAGIAVPGHTELLAELTGTSDYCMMQYSDAVVCSFVTTHIGYSDVPKELSIDRIERVIDLTAEALQRIEAKPKTELSLVVCGLNPHAGEGGLFGNREEENFIAPAIQRTRSHGLKVLGPLPPDTCFIPARRAETDAYICMYHDQGHIPLKALAFDRAVNITLGLPIIRTSVDHGTALDIAGEGIAQPGSMIHAIQLATRLASPAITPTRPGA